MVTQNTLGTGQNQSQLVNQLAHQQAQHATGTGQTHSTQNSQHTTILPTQGRLRTLPQQNAQATTAPDNRLNWAGVDQVANQQDSSQPASLRNNTGPTPNIPALSDTPNTRTGEISNIVGGQYSPNQQKLLQSIAQSASARAATRTDGVKAKIIGAGPTGQLQALKALQQGVPTTIIEKRTGFSRDNIFQIDRQDFDQSVGQYLSQDVRDQLTQLGVIESKHVPESPNQRARDVVVVTIRDLENILHGVVADQAQRSEGRLNIQFNASFNAEDVQNAAPNERIVFAFGSGYVRDTTLSALNTQGFNGKINAWQDTPRGAAITLRYGDRTVDTASINELEQTLSRAIGDHSKFNFLHLPQQKHIQVNLQLSEGQFKQWVQDSPRASWGGVDWAQAEQLNTANNNLLAQALPDNDANATFLQLLHNIDPAPGLWVNEAPITQLTESAALIPREGGDPVPVAFVGDAQATNWFLRGDGNPREELTTDIVDANFFVEQSNFGLAERVDAINNRSLDQISVHNTAIPGSLYPTGRLQRSPSLPANLDGLKTLGADLRAQTLQSRNINLAALL